MLETKKKIEEIRTKREKRVRGKIFGTHERPRLSVFRSAEHIYVQAIADDRGQTIAAASTLNSELRDTAKGKNKTEAAKAVGKLIAARLLEKGITRVVFDRGRFLYHGRVKALADSARESGLQF